MPANKLSKEELEDLAKEHQKMFPCKICENPTDFATSFDLLDSEGRMMGSVHEDCIARANRFFAKEKE